MSSTRKTHAPDRLGAVYTPPPSPHEGCICPNGYHPERGFLFIVDEKESSRVFLGSREAGAIFAELRPGMRVAFDVYATLDGQRRAHRVQILSHA